MIKPLGPNVLIKIRKRKSSIELINSTPLENEAEALVQAIGTKCSLGLEIGDNVMFRHNTMPVIVEENTDYDLIIVPEVSILYIKNYQREE